MNHLFFGQPIIQWNYQKEVAYFCRIVFNIQIWVHLLVSVQSFFIFSFTHSLTFSVYQSFSLSPLYLLFELIFRWMWINKHQWASIVDNKHKFIISHVKMVDCNEWEFVFIDLMQMRQTVWTQQKGIKNNYPYSTDDKMYGDNEPERLWLQWLCKFHSFI